MADNDGDSSEAHTLRSLQAAAGTSANGPSLRQAQTVQRTYRGLHNIHPPAAELKVPIHWRPVLVGGVFSSINMSVSASRERPVPAKRDSRLKGLRDWAHSSGLQIFMPPKVSLVNSINAMRGCLWLGPQGQLVPFVTAVFETCWGHDGVISRDAVLTEVCNRCDIDKAALQAGIANLAVRDRLRSNTDELMRCGGFGSQMICVSDDMFLGNDRLPLVAEALRRRAG